MDRNSQENEAYHYDCLLQNKIRVNLSRDQTNLVSIAPVLQIKVNYRNGYNLL